MVISGRGEDNVFQYIKKYYNALNIFVLNNRKIDIIHYNLKVI